MNVVLKSRQLLYGKKLDLKKCGRCSCILLEVFLSLGEKPLIEQLYLFGNFY